MGNGQQQQQGQQSTAANDGTGQQQVNVASGKEVGCKSHNQGPSINDFRAEGEVVEELLIFITNSTDRLREMQIKGTGIKIRKILQASFMNGSYGKANKSIG